VLGNALTLHRGLGLLRRRSLLSVQSSSAELRYRILNTVRDYLQGVMTVQPSAEARLNHARHYSESALEVRSLLEEGEWEAGNARLWSENENFEAAMSFAATTGEHELIKTFSHALARPYYEAGVKREFERLASLCEGIDDEDLRIEIDGLRGSHARRNGNAAEAMAIWLDRAERSLRLGRFNDYGDSLLDCAHLALEEGWLQETEALLARFHEESERYGTLVVASGLLVSARFALSRGDFDSSIRKAVQAEELGNPVATHGQAPFLWRSLAEIYRRIGDLEKSERMARRVVSEVLLAGHYHSVGIGLLELSETLEAKGRLEEAAEAIAVARAIPRSVSTALQDATKVRYRSFASRNGRSLIVTFDGALKENAWTDVAAKIGRSAVD
jgi:hypothetical protein